MSTGRIIRSEAMDALRAKNEDARSRLSDRFIAFVQTERTKKGVFGYVFYGTNARDELLKMTGPKLFTLFGVGSPVVKVQDVRAAVNEFIDYTAEHLDERDVHGSVISEMLRSYQAMVLEDKDEARANPVEVLILDWTGRLFWVGYDGTENYFTYKPKGKMMVLRGCYDPAVRRRVTSLLNTRIRGRRMNKKAIASVLKELKKATKLKNVNCIPIAP